jgi:pre-rRNA-processing protein IPI1
MPYFTVNHPIHGKLLGPYSKLPHLRRLCLDTVTALLACGRTFGVEVSEACGGVLEAVDSVVAGTVEGEYWTHVCKGISSAC